MSEERNHCTAAERMNLREPITLSLDNHWAGRDSLKFSIRLPLLKHCVRGFVDESRGSLECLSQPDCYQDL